MLRAMEESIDAPKHRRNASTMSESSSSFDFNPITPGSSKLILQHILIYLMEMLILSVHSASFSKRTSRWCFDEKLFLQSLYKVKILNRCLLMLD